MKQKVLIAWLLFFLVSKNLNAQIKFEVLVTTSQDQVANSGLPTIDGGYISCGYTYEGPGSYAISVVKFNENGDTTWTKMFGLTNGHKGVDIVQTNDSSYIVSAVTPTFSPGWDALTILKLNPLGTVLWGKVYNSTWDGYSGGAMAETNDGGYITAGNLAYGVHPVILKIDSSGAIDWHREYFGQQKKNYVQAIDQTYDGGYIVAGYSGYTSTGDYDAMLFKIDSMGTMLWAKLFVGNNDDRFYDVKQTSDGGFIMIGSTSSSGAGFDDQMLVKTNAAGDTLWTRTFGSTYTDVGHSVREIPTGYIIAGKFANPFVSPSLIKTDSNGNVDWSWSYRPSGAANDIHQTTDGGYVLFGESNFNNKDIYVVKTDALGHYGCPPSNFSPVQSHASVTITDTLYTDSPHSVQLQNYTFVSGSNGPPIKNCFTTSINNVENREDIFLSPNPVIRNVTVRSELMQNENCHISIYDILGKCMFSTDIRKHQTIENEISIDVSSMIDGIYFICLQAQSQSASSIMVIKK